jgi:hypothetical protein
MMLLHLALVLSFVRTPVPVASTTQASDRAAPVIALDRGHSFHRSPGAAFQLDHSCGFVSLDSSIAVIHVFPAQAIAPKIDNLCRASWSPG